MVFRADGGLYITNTGGTAPYDSTKLITTRGGACLSGNGTDWVNGSSRESKENYRPVNGRDLLDRLEKLPITQWNYINEADSVVHIGPVAEDFRKLFSVGNDDKSISTVDPSGIALAAVKELYKQNQDIQKENENLKQQLQELTEKVDRLTAAR